MISMKPIQNGTECRMLNRRVRILREEAGFCFEFARYVGKEATIEKTDLQYIERGVLYSTMCLTTEAFLATLMAMQSEAENLGFGYSNDELD